MICICVLSICSAISFILPGLSIVMTFHVPMFIHKFVFRLTCFGLFPFIHPTFLDWDLLTFKFSGARWLALRPTPSLEDQELFCRGYHALAERSSFKAPDTRLHPPIFPMGRIWWLCWTCQLGRFLSFPETFTRHECFHRDLVIHSPSSFLNRAWDQLWRSCSKNTEMSDLRKIRPVGAELFHADGQTWRS